VGAVLGVAFAWGASRLLLARYPGIRARSDSCHARRGSTELYSGRYDSHSVPVWYRSCVRATATRPDYVIESRPQRNFAGARSSACAQGLWWAKWHCRCLACRRGTVRARCERDGCGCRFQQTERAPDANALALRATEDQRLSSMMRRLEERVGSLPGVQSSSFALTSRRGRLVAGRHYPCRTSRSERDPTVDLNIMDLSIRRDEDAHRTWARSKLA